jgi:hypothetical protein
LFDLPWALIGFSKSEIPISLGKKEYFEIDQGGQQH